ncbi:MAG TPA: TauD/TfdA family dioxygenase, partial [Novosphingobium sp.]|nr:TauD/TfdA family dioxygenase [Novosphingobium sp.]
MAKMTVEQLDPDLPFGARVKGLTRDLTQDEEVRAELNRLFEDRGMIVFEGVEATPAMQVAISTVFGPLKDHPVASVDRADAKDKDMVGVIEITNHPGACIVEIDGEPLVTWQPWHFDHAYNNELNRAGVLRSITIAGRGGQTAFADGIQIHRDMNPDILKKAEGVEVLYNLDLRYTEQRFGLPENFRVLREHSSTLHEDAKKMPCSIHPVLWTRETGEKVLHAAPWMA